MLRVPLVKRKRSKFWVDIKTCGTSCIAIRRATFGKVQALYFEFHHNEDRMEVTMRVGTSAGRFALLD
jgi:hypothetical protein